MRVPSPTPSNEPCVQFGDQVASCGPFQRTIMRQTACSRRAV
jgi:hypothetical protein